jgi:hypothetical protein
MVKRLNEIKKEEKVLSSAEELYQKILHRRPAVQVVLEVLKEDKSNGGLGLRFRDIKLALLKKGILCSDTGIYFAYTWLIDQGKAVKNGNLYSLVDSEGK